MNYKTKQSELIEEYLKVNADRHLTVDDICAGLKNEVGRTTVYRNLEKLCLSGNVRKYVLSDGGSACYQYADCGAQSRHFHLKCLKCGRLFHLECEHLEEIDGHIRAEHGFAVDPTRTVFYGLCEKCLSEQKEVAE